MVSDGVEEVNFFKLLAPEELWTEADDAYTNLWTRRPGFELALRRHVEAHPGIDLVSPAACAGLVFASGAPRRVVGLRLGDGRVLEADYVFDGGGRRSPVPRWLADAGINVPHVEQDCDGTYFGRYYRRDPASSLDPLLLIGNANATARLQFNTFPGDHDTYGLFIVIRPEDKELHALRHDAVFDEVVKRIPALAPWTEPDAGKPLHHVEMMAGNRNRRWHYIVDDEPLVLGLLPIGDALCTTNPFYGWGASMALTYAFAAAEAVAAHDDLRHAALSYEAAIAPEADGVYRESAAADRLRSYQWRNIPVPAWDREEMERQDLVRCIGAGSLRDPVLGRAFLRRTGLLESPDVVLDDREVVEHARNTQRILAAKTPRKVGPDDDELADILAGHSLV
jgi:2-polyprenyl-6-methoxyphenol hydroxylase-like FAD-dependent oxidoreductase